MRPSLLLSLSIIFAASFCLAISDIFHYHACISCGDSLCDLSNDYDPVDVAQVWSESSVGEITYRGKVNNIRAQYTVHGPRIALINKECKDGIVNVDLRTKGERYNHTILYQVPALTECIIKGYPDKDAVKGVKTYLKKEY